MKVRILVEAPYADFSKMPKLGAQNLKVGDEIDYPDYYALDIIDAGLAELFIATDVVDEMEIEAEDIDAYVSATISATEIVDSIIPNATLGAQKLAEEHGVDLADVKATGKDGRIVKSDVQALVEG